MSRDDVGALAAAARNGDQAAFRRLFEMHQAGVYSLIAYLVRSADEAADLVQTTFIKAWRALPRLQEPATFTAWLYRIARNVVKDHRKQAGRGQRTLPLTNASQVMTNSAEEVLVAEERRQAVRRAIEALPDQHREVVVMHHLNGLDVKTISEALGLPANTVISRLSRARQTLRRKLLSVVEEG